MITTQNIYQMAPEDLYNWALDKMQNDFNSPEADRRLMKGIRRLAVLLDVTVDEVIEELVADALELS